MSDKDWKKIEDEKPSELSFIKFICKKPQSVFSGHYVFDDNLRSIHLGQFYRDGLYSFGSESLNKRIADVSQIETWAYLDLSGPSEGRR